MATDSQQLQQDPDTQDTTDETSQNMDTPDDSQPDSPQNQQNIENNLPENDSANTKMPKTKNPSANLNSIISMKVPIIVRIANKRMHIADVLKLNHGSVVQFEQDAYQHVDLMVNNKVIGLGQPVKAGENFGLKITQIGALADTIKSLGQNSDE